MSAVCLSCAMKQMFHVFLPVRCSTDGHSGRFGRDAAAVVLCLADQTGGRAISSRHHSSLFADAVANPTPAKLSCEAACVGAGATSDCAPVCGCGCCLARSRASVKRVLRNSERLLSIVSQRLFKSCLVSLMASFRPLYSTRSSQPTTARQTPAMSIHQPSCHSPDEAAWASSAVMPASLAHR